MSNTSRHVFRLPSASDENGTYRMRTPQPHSSPRTYLHVPHRRTRRLAILVALLACGASVCFACAYWLFTTRYGDFSTPHTISRGPDTPPTTPYRVTKPSRQRDITLDALDEPDARLDALRADVTTTYLAYLPHSGLHNQRIALENAITLARLLNRTLLVPPARLGSKTLRYLRSRTLARMLRLSDKRQGRTHCAHVPPDVPPPDECVDYLSYTLVPWAWLVDLRPIEAQQALVRVSNGTGAWVQERLGVGANETLSLFDTDPYEYRFVDTSVPVRKGDKYLGAISIETLAGASERLIQLGTLFGSSRLRLRKTENERVRGEVRRRMVFANAAVTLAAERVGEVLGGTYVGAHVRVGDGRFERGAQGNVRLVWWKLVRDVLGLDTQTALELERHVLSRMDGTMVTDSNDEVGPPEMRPDMPSLRVPHSALPALPYAFSPKRPCRNRLYTTPSLRVLNVPLFIATDAPQSLDDPLLAPLATTFPCTFTLSSFGAETAHLAALRNGYDGVRLAEYLSPIVDALVMGGAWAVVGTEGSTFSRYVEDVLWRVSHGWDIVQRG